MNPQYQFHQSVIDGYPCYISNINIWDYNGEPTGEITQVIDPLYGKPHNFPIFKLSDGFRSIQFAAGEFSNTIWGIYCLKTKEE